MTDDERARSRVRSVSAGEAAEDAVSEVDVHEAALPVPTPEELLAETDANDPDVGIDGTGVGELP